MTKRNRDSQQAKVYQAESIWHNLVDPVQYVTQRAPKTNALGVTTWSAERQVPMYRFKGMDFDNAKRAFEHVLYDSWFRERAVYEFSNYSHQYRLNDGTSETWHKWTWMNVFDRYKTRFRKQRSDGNRYSGTVTFKLLGSAQCPEPHVLISFKWCSTTTILHELAHVMSGPNQNHGAIFTANMLALVRHYLDKEDAEVLAGCYAQEGVEVAELTPYERMWMEQNENAAA